MAYFTARELDLKTIEPTGAQRIIEAESLKGAALVLRDALCGGTTGPTGRVLYMPDGHAWTFARAPETDEGRVACVEK